ncbi:polyketide synthase dehydratase domain-containing protein, partial [Frankia sp. CNm7]|nr:polyketide synthase dehydratase domain-containing protein [Frankia nepalensis]
LFRQTIEAMYAAGARVFVQVGPGRLGGLVDGVLEDSPHLTIAANSAHRDGLGQLRRLAVALWVEQGNPDLAALDLPAPANGAPATAVHPREGVGAAGQREDHLVRLDLSAATITLDPARLPRIAGTGAAPARPGSASGDDGPVIGSSAADPTGRHTAARHSVADHPLAAWADQDSVARELMALLTETADTAATVLAHAATAGDARGAEPDGELRRAPTGPGWTATLRVSTATMPYLLDHALTPQPPGWPDLLDRRPVLAATTTVQLMAEYAQKASSRIAVGVYDVRFENWLPAEPPTDVVVRVQPEARDRFRITFVGFSSGLVRVADAYPTKRPQRWPFDPDSEQTPTMTGREFYQERWMFHGPAFQGVTTFLGHGPSHIRAVLRASDTPGGLLDAAGQLLGYWIRSRENDRFVMFPVRFGIVEFFGPEPPPGRAVTCHAWVQQFDNEWVDAHLQLVDGNQVWAVVHGWVDRRFDLPAELDEAYRWPERHPFGRVVADGWVLACERWSDLAVREMVLNRYASSAERSEYDATPPALRREWLLRRMAIKDAVRIRLWGQRHPEIFPAQIRVMDPFGQLSRAEAGAGPGAGSTPTPQVEVIDTGGRPLPPFAIWVASTSDLAVAHARPVTGQASTGRPARVVLAVEPPGLVPGQAKDDPPATVDLDAPWWRRRLALAREAAARARGVDVSQALVVNASRLPSDPSSVTVSVAVPAGDDRPAVQHTVTCAETDLVIPGPGAGGPGRRIAAWTTDKPEIADETAATLMGVKE